MTHIRRGDVVESTSNALEVGNVSRIEDRLERLEGLVREIRGLVGPFGALLPDGKMLVHTLHGLKLIIDPLELVMAPQLIVYRQWEPDITNLMREYVHTNTVFVDVGANIGYFTCLVASIIRNEGCGKVIAIEPNPECLALLDRNVSINWSMCEIEVHRSAAANFKGTSRLAVPVNRAANAHLDLGKIASSEPLHEVLVAPLDELVGEEVIVDLLKIDVEGHEWAVLQGARNLLERSPSIKIIMEWSASQMSAAGFSTKEMLNAFDELKLVAHRLPNNLNIDGHTLAEFAYTDDQLSAVDYANILLVRRD